MKQLINIKYSFVLKNLFIALCFLLLWSCGHKSTKFDESGLFILAEDTIFGGISYEDRIRPVFEGYGRNEAYQRGLVPDKETAIKIAESVWYPIFGSQIYNEQPFEAVLEGDSVWFVHGNLPPDKRGGCAEIRIRKKDSSIIYVAHQK